MALKFFPHTISLSEVYHMEGFSNWIKTERMVNNYFSSCNSEQLENIAKKVWERDTHKHAHMHTYMHMHTNLLDKSNVKKNQACTGRANLV